MKTSSAALGLLAAAAASPVLGIELYKRHNAEPRVIGFPLQRNADRQVSDAVARDARRLARRAGTVSGSLINEDTLYFLNVSIGTPAQDFSLHLDTGSSDLWVNTAGSSLCQSRGSPCDVSGTFNANDSSTYEYLNSQFNITYEDGSGASGDYVTDTLRLDGHDVTGFEFAIGYVSSSEEGLCGIGYENIEAGTNGNGLKPYQNLPAKLAADGLIASNAYSLWLNDLQANTGNILFGGVDRSQYIGDLVTVPINKLDGGYYEFLVTASEVTFDGQTVSSDQSLSVLLDSGTSLIYLPDDAVTLIYNSVNANYESDEGVATVDCDLANQNLNMTFNFNGAVSISVPITELVLPSVEVTNEDGSPSSNGENTESNNVCIFGVSPAGNTQPVLGDTFLRSAYVVYDLDNNEISLAQSNFNATDTDVVEIGTGTSAVPSATGVASQQTNSGSSSSSSSSKSGSSSGSGAGVPEMMRLWPLVPVLTALTIGFVGFLA